MDELTRESDWRNALKLMVLRDGNVGIVVQVWLVSTSREAVLLRTVPYSWTELVGAAKA